MRIAKILGLAMLASAACGRAESTNDVPAVATPSIAASEAPPARSTEPSKSREQDPSSFEAHHDRVLASAQALPHAKDASTIRVTFSETDVGACWGAKCGEDDTLLEIGEDGTVRIGWVTKGVPSELKRLDSKPAEYTKLRRTIDELGLCSFAGDYVMTISHGTTYAIDVPCGTESKRFVLRWNDWKNPDHAPWPDVPWDEMRKLQRVVDDVLAFRGQGPSSPR